MSAIRFYKFRAVTETDNLAEDYALQALINSYAIFSGRKNFNDLFDSKIDIPHPTPEQILGLLQDPRIGSHATTVNTWLSSGALTPDGRRALSEWEASLNNLFDSYPIYSLSIHNDCHLLWAHYAAWHTGFCIEFEFPNIQPHKVAYREHIECVPLIDFMKSRFGLIGDEFGTRIHDALLVKMDCWAYEGEYRWIASHELVRGGVPKGHSFVKVRYERQWVKAIIFGCRTPANVKSYILKHLPFTTEFKQAVETKDRIEVVSFDEHSHL